MKGRQPEAQALADVQALIGKRPAEGHRRDLLIEHLHLLNDHYRGLFERHLVALAFEMNLSLAEVYEVATFYHHFHVLRDDETVAIRNTNKLLIENQDFFGSMSMVGDGLLLASKRLPQL